MALLRRSQVSLLGIDISSTTVKLLELSRSGSRYRVESYAVEPLPPNSVIEKTITDPNLVGEAIARAWKKSGTTIGRASGLLLLALAGLLILGGLFVVFILLE